jgi:hypothetical protein
MMLIMPSIVYIACITLAGANPILDDIMQYDIIFTAKYEKLKSGSRYVVQKEIKGIITKPIMNRVDVIARVEMKDNQMVLFKFWKNGSKEFEMETIDKKNRLSSMINNKYHFLDIKELIDAVNRENMHR